MSTYIPFALVLAASLVVVANRLRQSALVPVRIPVRARRQRHGGR